RTSRAPTCFARSSQSSASKSSTRAKRARGRSRSESRVTSISIVENVNTRVGGARVDDARLASREAEAEFVDHDLPLVPAVPPVFRIHFDGPLIECPVVSPRGARNVELDAARENGLVV